MKDVSHANPYTGETAGQLFSRGPIVVADGGRAEAVDDNDTEADGADEDEAESEREMKYVSHTPPKDAEDANRVFERGGSEAPRASEQSSGRSPRDESEDDVEYEE